MRSRIVLMVGAVTLVVASGCGADDEPSVATEPTSTSSSMASSMAPSPTPSVEPTDEPSPEPTSEQTPVPDVPEALDFTAAAVGGGTFDARELAGTPVVFWFWAPWCPVCQREAPLIADLADRYDGEVEFVGVAGLTSDLGGIEGFVADRGVDGFAHIDDRDGAVYARFEVTQQYDLGVVTADGEVEILRGPLTEDQITSAVDALAAG